MEIVPPFPVPSPFAVMVPSKTVPVVLVTVMSPALPDTSALLDRLPALMLPLVLKVNVPPPACIEPTEIVVGIAEPTTNDPPERLPLLIVAVDETDGVALYKLTLPEPPEPPDAVIVPDRASAEPPDGSAVAPAITVTLPLLPVPEPPVFIVALPVFIDPAVRAEPTLLPEKATICTLPPEPDAPAPCAFIAVTPV